MENACHYHVQHLIRNVLHRGPKSVNRLLLTNTLRNGVQLERWYAESVLACQLVCLGIRSVASVVWSGAWIVRLRQYNNGLAFCFFLDHELCLGVFRRLVFQWPLSVCLPAFWRFLRDGSTVVTINVRIQGVSDDAALWWSDVASNALERSNGAATRIESFPGRNLQSRPSTRRPSCDASHTHR